MIYQLYPPARYGLLVSIVYVKDPVFGACPLMIIKGTNKNI